MVGLYQRIAWAFNDRAMQNYAQKRRLPAPQSRPKHRVDHSITEKHFTWRPASASPKLDFVVITKIVKLMLSPVPSNQLRQSAALEQDSPIPACHNTHSNVSDLQNEARSSQCIYQERHQFIRLCASEHLLHAIRDKAKMGRSTVMDCLNSGCPVTYIC